MCLYCDNKLDTNITHNLLQHNQTKYIKINIYFIKEKLDNGPICSSHMPKSSQLVDVLTKSISNPTF